MRFQTCRFARPHSHISTLVRVFALGLAGVGLTGCATSQQPPQYAGVYQPPAPIPQAGPDRKADVEADGRPAQLPPARRPLPEEDDPSQPWSPNYGRPPGTYQRPVAPPARSAAVRAPQPQPVPQVQTTAALPERTLRAAEADAVILRAIQAHEVRKP
jgi:hypothetical protein